MLPNADVIAAPGSDAPDIANGPPPARRSLWALAALVLGYVFAQRVDVRAELWFSAACVACAAALVLRGRTCAWTLLVAVVLLAGGWYTERLRFDIGNEAPFAATPPLVDNDIIRLRMQLTHNMTSVVTRTGSELPMPYQVPPTARTTGFVLSAWRGSGGSAGWQDGDAALRGIMNIVVENCRPESCHVQAGDVVEATGRFVGVRAPANPGQTDDRLWAAQEGRLGTLIVTHPDLIRRIEGGKRTTFQRVAGAWWTCRGWAQRRAAGALTMSDGTHPGGHALLGALLIGQDDSALSEVTGAFGRLGLIHILSISGFHLVVMTGVGLFVLRLTGERGRWESILAGAMIVLFLIVVPAEAPVLRSGILVLAVMTAEASGRRYDPIGLLGWIAVVLAVWRPLDVFTLGFQLSFGIVGALILWGKRVHEVVFLPPLRGTTPVRRSAARRAAQVVGARGSRLFSATLAAWLVSTPVVAYHAGVVSLAAIPGTLLLLPAVVVLMWAGYIAVALGCLWQGPGTWLMAALERPANWVAEAALWLDGLAWTSLDVPRMSVALAWAGVLVAGCWCAGKRGTRFWAAVCVLTVWGGLEWRDAGRLPPDVRCVVHTLDVGDGSCHILRVGDEALLWDCGSSRPGLGVRVIPRAARALGVGAGVPVRTAIITHPNYDHYSALLDAAGPLSVQRILVTRRFIEAAERGGGGDGAGGIPAIFLSRARARGIALEVVAAGHEEFIGNGNQKAVLRFLAPDAEALTLVGDNDTSLAAILEIPTDQGPRRLLFTGDLQEDGLRELKRAAPLCDWVEAPHHGAATAAARAFVESCGARTVVQSTGPRRASQGGWEDIRIMVGWWSTAEIGAVTTEIWREGRVQVGEYRTEYKHSYFLEPLGDEAE